MKFIPNILSSFRIFFFLFLIYLNPKKLLFIFIYIICGILDVLDGFIARKFNVTSKLGAKLDSIPDMIMIFVILFRFVPTMGLNLFMIFIVATLTAIEEILIDLTMYSLDLDRKFYFNIK